MRTPEVIGIIGKLGPELDRTKGAGKSHDAARDPGQYLDLGDNGAIGGGPVLSVLPLTRERYDTTLHGVATGQYRYTRGSQARSFGVVSMRSECARRSHRYARRSVRANGRSPAI